MTEHDPQELASSIKRWGQAFGFAKVGITNPNVLQVTPKFAQWLQKAYYGQMHYMVRNAHLRTNPQALLPDTQSIISVCLPYMPQAMDYKKILDNKNMAYISRYALGRDYHRVVKKRLQKLAGKISVFLKNHDVNFSWAYRVFSDSAPVLEVELARKSGVAWQGKNTLAVTRKGSFYFLGEVYTTLNLPEDDPTSAHCGSCEACLKACPTSAIIAPYTIDANRCISYLTIEFAGSIPEPLRPLIGNRIYGCDDCQLYCPWNRFAEPGVADFSVHHALDATPLDELFRWGKDEFENRLSGSPIRRVGHERWLRNIAVALGNTADPSCQPLLQTQLAHPSPLVREHVLWALERIKQGQKGSSR